MPAAAAIAAAAAAERKFHPWERKINRANEAARERAGKKPSIDRQLRGCGAAKGVRLSECAQEFGSR